MIFSKEKQEVTQVANSKKRQLDPSVCFASLDPPNVIKYALPLGFFAASVLEQLNCNLSCLCKWSFDPAPISLIRSCWHSADINHVASTGFFLKRSCTKKYRTRAANWMPVTLFITFHAISIRICLDFMVTDTLSPPPPKKKETSSFSWKVASFYERSRWWEDFGRTFIGRSSDSGILVLIFLEPKKHREFRSLDKKPWASTNDFPEVFTLGFGIFF